MNRYVFFAIPVVPLVAAIIADVTDPAYWRERAQARRDLVNVTRPRPTPRYPTRPPADR